MNTLRLFAYLPAGLLALAAAAAPSVVAAEPPASSPAAPSWAHAGWGGGGFYYATVFHPTRDGVIYLAGDCNGVYKSEDRGRNWAIINNGLVDYGVFSLAVDRKNPETLYAATEGGLCKSTDGGAHWLPLPRTGRKELRITGEKGKSIRCIAVDPADGNIVYAGSPGGKVYKSTDGGQTWAASYEKKAKQDAQERNALRVQFGKVNGDYHGGFWMPLEFPKDVKAEECSGFGFAFKAEGARPRDVFVTLKTAAGISYRSRNLSELFQAGEWRDVVLGKADFAVDPEYAKKNAEQAKSQPSPQWATVNRVDFVCVGSLPQEASVGWFGKFFFAFTPAGGTAGQVAKPALVTVRDFAKDKKVWAYGNVRAGQSEGGAVYSVAVAPSEPSLVLAATDGAGLLISTDAGATWRGATDTPSKASSAAVAAGDANIIYASFHTDGVWKSTNKGETWKRMSQGLPKTMSITEVAVGPAGGRDVYAIGTVGWGGAFYRSADGGETWTASSTLTPDAQNDPTLPQEPKPAPLSVPTNLAVNPNNPKELFISANWRSCMSQDGGASWSERMKGADISCIYDIRFSGPRTYAAAMDEGTLVSEDNGRNWKPLWPLKWNPEISGHNWRLAVTPGAGGDGIVVTCSPWESKYPNRVILSPDGGKTYKVVTEGLPAYIPRSNTMWGTGYARAMAVDPGSPQVLYLGIDGDPAEGNAGGGIFKSADGGNTWKQLPSQPGSRRMFFGLAVDPTDSKRLFWAACGDRGGLYSSPDGGESWELVFKNEQWCFNVMVMADGTIYCPGKNLWRSADHGKTWAQLTKFTGERVIVAMEPHPRDPKTMWFTATTWDGSADGGVYKTADGGATWREITGDLPYRKPMVLRFNPQTNELWAGGVGLYRAKQ